MRCDLASCFIADFGLSGESKRFLAADLVCFSYGMRELCRPDALIEETGYGEVTSAFDAALFGSSTKARVGESG